MAPNGQAFTHIPQPMHMGSLIAANLDVRFTETQILPEHTSEKVNVHILMSSAKIVRGTLDHSRASKLTL